MSECQSDANVDQYQFISSLSKSLQSLCHGCMEFDCDIEIMGYININIDHGNKVDCVLDEKVLKNSNKHVTFVSNSFLAQKKQLKETCDQSCSTSNPDNHRHSFPSDSVAHEQSRYQNPPLQQQETLHPSFHTHTISDAKKRYSNERAISPAKLSFEENQQILFNNCATQFESNPPNFQSQSTKITTPSNQPEMFSLYNNSQTTEAANLKNDLRETLNPFNAVKNDANKQPESGHYDHTEIKSHSDIMELSGWNRGVYSLLEKMYYNQHMSESYKKNESTELSTEASCSKIQDSSGKLETNFPYDSNTGKSNNDHVSSDFTYVQNNAIGIEDLYGGTRVKLEKSNSRKLLLLLN